MPRVSLAAAAKAGSVAAYAGGTGLYLLDKLNSARVPGKKK